MTYLLKTLQLKSLHSHLAGRVGSVFISSSLIALPASFLVPGPRSRGRSGRCRKAIYPYSKSLTESAEIFPNDTDRFVPHDEGYILFYCHRL